MLTHEEIATIVRRHSMYPGETIEQRLESAIRLAIAETAEACAKVCKRFHDEIKKAGGDADFSDALDCADAIRAAAKGAK